MTMMTKNEEKRNLFDTWHAAWNVIDSFAVDLAGSESKTVEVYAEIIAIADDLSARATFEVAGLFYRNTGGDVTMDGSITKPKLGSLLVDVDIVANISDETIEIKVQGIADTLIHWECKAQFRTRTKVQDYTGNPRLQVSIVGMRAAKKFGWMGLSDGINYVLNPTSYGHQSQTTGTVITVSEYWTRAISKKLRGVFFSDVLRMQAFIKGTTGSPSTNRSRHTLIWETYDGDWGSGAQINYSDQVTEIVTGLMDGKLRRRTLNNWSAVGSPAVTFLWSRYDVRGWRNYL